MDSKTVEEGVSEQVGKHVGSKVDEPMNCVGRSNPRLNNAFPGLDIVKFLCSILVVSIHIKPFSNDTFLEKSLSSIQCVAVPFFFIASSFLCFRGVDIHELQGSSSTPSSRRLKNTILKLLRLYVTWTLVYLPVTVFGFMLNGTRPSVALLIFLRGFLVIGENFCSWPLWYLLASVIGFSLVYKLLKRGVSWQAILAVGLSVSMMGYCMEVFRDEKPFVYVLDLYFRVFVNVRNGFFVAYPYIALGLALAVNEDWVKHLPVKEGMSLVVSGLLGCVLFSNDVHLPFCALFATGVFALSIKCRGNAFPRLRALSTIVYLIHMLVAVVIVYVICGGREVTLTANGMSGPTLFLCDICVSLFLGLVITGLTNQNDKIRGLFGM